MRRPALLLVLFFYFTGYAQVAFWSDQFAGGIVTGGFSVDVEPSGSGSFSTPIPPGATIHQAWFFAARVGPAPALTVQLNGTPYTFDATNQAGPSFASLYSPDCALHGIDLTSDIDPLVGNYTVDVPIQMSLADRFPDFYLFIAYLLPGASTLSVDLYLNDLDMGQQLSYSLATSAPISATAPVAFATMAGYTSVGPVDCESISVSGMLLGTFELPDFNNVGVFGAIASFSHVNNVLTGLGDDVGDQSIGGADVLSDISALVTTGDSVVNVVYDHCPSPFPGDNHIWLMIVSYAPEVCGTAVSLGPDTTICGSSAALLDPVIMDAALLWQDGSSADTYTATTTGTYWVRATWPDCVRTDTILITFSEPPLLDLGNDTTFCSGASVMLDATIAGGSYVWSTGATTPMISIDSGGIYSVLVVANGCSVTDTLELVELPLPLVYLGADAAACTGDTIVLSAGTAGEVLWQNGSESEFLPVTQTGIYSVTVASSGCVNMDSISIVFDPPVAVDIGPDLLICPEETLSISVPLSGAFITWPDGTGANTYAITTPGTYTVVVTNGACATADSIVVAMGPCELIVSVPNAFSPDRDGFNEGFHPIIHGALRSYLFRVYDRWGEVIYTSTTPSEAWDGTYHDSPVQNGVYVWQLNYTPVSGVQRSLVERLGHVTLLR